MHHPAKDSTRGGDTDAVDVSVVGNGIVGLTVARRLSEAGCDVTLIADRAPDSTTSMVAAAIWYLYRALPRNRVTDWGTRTFAALTELAVDPSTGVTIRRGRELFREPTPDPWWSNAVPRIDRIPAAQLPDGYADGLLLDVPVVDMPRHLTWLLHELRAAGVASVSRRLDRLEDAGGDLVVNCTGLGARELVPDPSVTPIRGQVVIVEQCGIDEWLLDQSDPANLVYVVPRTDTVVLGGTADEGSDRQDPDPRVAAAIVERCASLLPALRDAAIVETRVGLRPSRPAVRLERSTLLDGRPVVHCYGHGGAGVTLSYGCAEDVVDLVVNYPS
jgi:D-amino-acid oxidase